jgi:hypothetical protein
LQKAEIDLSFHSVFSKTPLALRKAGETNLMFYLNLSGIFVCPKQNISFNKGMLGPRIDDTQVKSLPD